MSAAIILLLLIPHALAAVVWVGGMFFAYMALRPAALFLEPPFRLELWVKTFSKFFPWVWMSVIILLVTGFGLVHGTTNLAPYVLIMMALGIAMIAIFVFIYYQPFKSLKTAVEEKNYPVGAQQLGRIRHLIAVNLIFGLIVVSIAIGGRYLTVLFA